MLYMICMTYMIPIFVHDLGTGDGCGGMERDAACSDDI